MRLENIKVYDLEESIIASGYPMQTTTMMRPVIDKDWRRCKNLTKASNGNGAHGQWMTGVRVSFDLTFTNKAWVEAERYRFLEFVSSQSTMHRITKFDISKQYNEYVDPIVIQIMVHKIDEYNRLCERIEKITNKETRHMLEEQRKRKYLEILYTNPSGFELTARLTTDYRCLLNIYIQRYNHRLPEWREFCKKLLKLPGFKELVDAYNSGKVEL